MAVRGAPGQMVQIYRWYETVATLQDFVYGYTGKACKIVKIVSDGCRTVSDGVIWLYEEEMAGGADCTSGIRQFGLHLTIIGRCEMVHCAYTETFARNYRLYGKSE